MRPHSLRFSGIGSYPGDVQINFDDLNRKGLYLIVGPTGAGKTTVLDAMTYALYGKVAQDRENAIVSAHANSKPPKIELEFSQGGRRYVFHREPAAPGKTAVPAKQWMRELGPAGEELRTVTGARQVTDSAKEIVGLTADEFMQVILLPQGKFQQFLMAKGSDKQRVLQTIFGTWTYRRVVDRLIESAAKLKGEVSTGREELGKKYAVIDSNIKSLGDFDAFDDMPDSTQDLDAAVRFIASKSSELDVLEKRARDAHAQLTSDYKHAASEAERFDKAITLADLRKVHHSAEKAAQTARDRIEQHRRAEPVVAAASSRDAAVARAATLTKAVTDCRNLLAREAKRFKVAEEITKKLVSGLQTATPAVLSSDLARVQARLDAASEAHDTLGGLADQIQSNAGAAKEAAREVAGLAKDLIAAEAAEAQAKERLVAARQQSKGLSAAEKALNGLNELREKADVEGATQTLVAASAVLTAAQGRFDKAEAALRAAHDQRTRELAGVLAAELSPGEACPVCGSTEHPQKAKRSAGAARNLDEATAARDRASEHRLGAERDVADAQKALDTAKGFQAKLPTPAEQKKIEKAYDDLAAVAAALDGLDADHQQALGTIAELKDSLAEAKKEATRIDADAKNLLKEQARLQLVVDAVGPAKDVAIALDACDRMAEQLAELGKHVDDLVTVQGEVRQATAVAAKALTNSGFAEDKAAKASVLTTESLFQHEETVKAHDERAKTIDKLDAAVGTAPLPALRPEVNRLSAELHAAEAVAQSAAAVAGSARAARTQIDEALASINRIGPTIEEKSRQADLADSVATVFDKGAGGVGGQLSLEVWVQRTLFEEVCLVANEQLRSLSSNRYSLTLEQEEGGVSKRRGSGLDIYVLDSHTGTTRPVQTMSGGEQFIASLALALALAEVVQRHAGGIELPCLFIDEGFGGLDLDSLDLAIDVLGKIHAAGRTVGIITHVETMQKQLPTGIRVHKSDHGSTLEVLVD